jgi:hypothetical protein
MGGGPEFTNGSLASLSCPPLNGSIVRQTEDGFDMAPRVGKTNREGKLRRIARDGTLTPKMGSAAAARIDHVHDRGGCSYSFPHGRETTNSTASKNERSWKRSRKTAYRR